MERGSGGWDLIPLQQNELVVYELLVLIPGQAGIIFGMILFIPCMKGNQEFWPTLVQRLCKHVTINCCFSRVENNQNKK